MEPVIKKASFEDVELIHGIMVEIEKGMQVADHFVSSGRAFIRSHIEEAGVTYLAREGDAVMGFMILDFPGSGENNLGRDIGLAQEELCGVVHMDTIVVLPAYRGRGFQKTMLAYGEEQARARGYTRLMATVHPGNAASLKSFLGCGYAIVETKAKYGGVLRHILHKRLR